MTSGIPLQSTHRMTCCLGCFDACCRLRIMSAIAVLLLRLPPSCTGRPYARYMPAGSKNHFLPILDMYVEMIGQQIPDKNTMYLYLRRRKALFCLQNDGWTRLALLHLCAYITKSSTCAPCATQFWHYVDSVLPPLPQYLASARVSLCMKQEI